MVKNFPTGAAQPVTNTVERVRALFKDRVEWAPRQPVARQNFRRSQKPEPEAKLLEVEEDRGESSAGAAEGVDSESEQRTGNG